MARRIVESPATGEQFTFDDDWNTPRGEVGRIDYVLHPKHAVPPHFHPGVAQSFEVLTGRLHISVSGRTSTLTAGETAKTALGEVHAQWNEGPATVYTVEYYDPPIAIEPFFTVLPCALGAKNPCKLAVFLADFATITSLLPFRLRLLRALAPLARLCGFKMWYRPILAAAGLTWPPPPAAP